MVVAVDAHAFYIIFAARCWDPLAKPFLVAPAMNTVMWDSPVTEEQLARLRARGVRIVPPVGKVLACGDVGVGKERNLSTAQLIVSTHTLLFIFSHHRFDVQIHSAYRCDG